MESHASPGHRRGWSLSTANGDATISAGQELSVRKSVAVVLKESWVFRESGYIDGIVNPRYGAIYPHAVVTFRAATADMPTKVWPLHPLCKVGPVQGASFLVRGRNSNMLFALATQHLKRKSLFFFTIDWPHNHILGAEHLKLCFESAAAAEEWHAELDNAIGELTLAPDPAAALRLPRGHSLSALERSRSAEASRALGVTDSLEGLTGIPALSASMTVVAPILPIEEDDDVEAEAPVLQPPKQRWASFSHVNGVAVFREDYDEAGEGGAMMVSTIIRATPHAAWKALMDLDSNFMFPFETACVLERMDKHTRVVKGWLNPRGLAGILCAPREAVVEQTWRLEEDGTYIVLMQSTEHVKAPSATGSWLSWYRPVRAEVVACGYTIAPLQPKFQAPGGSSECLVTMVLKLNPGGWLGISHHARPSAFACAVANHCYPLLNSYVEPLLLSVITLRDKVEQERFVVKPFSLGQPTAVDEPFNGETPRLSELERSTTRIVRSELALPRLHRASAFTPAVTFSVCGSDARMPLVPTVAEQRQGSAQLADQEEAPVCRGTLDSKFWSYPGTAGFKLRGPTYLADKKKILSEEPLFALNSADLVEADEKVWEIGRFLPAIRNNPAPFTFVLNLIVPGPPWRNLVMSWSADYNPAGSVAQPCGKSPRSSVASSMVDGETARHAPSSAAGGSQADDGTDSECEAMSPFDVSLARFLSGEGPLADKNCSTRFKLIPSVLQGSWIIKQAVGNTPVLLGNKLDTKYFRCAKYFEMDVDIGSSYAACSVVNLVKGATKSLVLNFGVLVEGRADDELPERLIGTCQFAHLDMEAGMYLDPEGVLHHKDDVSPAVRQVNSKLSRSDSKLKVA